MKVLIIDDERAIRRALKEILEYENCQVLEAENGKEGLEMIRSNSLDVIFCDIKMPLVDGMELLEQVHTHLLTQQQQMLVYFQLQLLMESSWLR